MALATVDDVQIRMGRPLTVAEVGRASGLLAAVDALVVGYLGCSEATPNPVPDGLASTVAGIVARGMAASPVGVESVSVDDASVRYMADASSGGVWLSRMDRVALRPYRCGGGLTTVRLVGERS